MIITIGREFGSGGHEIAKKISERLNIKIYDKEIISQIALENNVSEALVTYYDEKPIIKSLFEGSTNAINIVDKNIPLEEQIYIAEKKFMLDVAKKEKNCIFVGRCANYIFKNEKDVLKIFITSPLEKRIERKMNQIHSSYNEVKKTVIQTDKQRAAYYKYHTGEIWNDRFAYDFYVNSGNLGIEKSVETIIGIINSLN